MNKHDKKIRVLQEIATDMEKDAKEFDGRLFNGRTVAEYFGNHGAAIAALANILQSLLVNDLASNEEELGNNGEPIKHYNEDDPRKER